MIYFCFFFFFFFFFFSEQPHNEKDRVIMSFYYKIVLITVFLKYPSYMTSICLAKLMVRLSMNVNVDDPNYMSREFLWVL